MNVGDQIPPTLPLQKGGIPLFGYLFPVAQAGMRGYLPARSPACQSPCTAGRRFGQGRGETFNR